MMDRAIPKVMVQARSDADRAGSFAGDLLPLADMAADLAAADGADPHELLLPPGSIEEFFAGFGRTEDEVRSCYHHMLCLGKELDHPVMVREHHCMYSCLVSRRSSGESTVSALAAFPHGGAPQ